MRNKLHRRKDGLSRAKPDRRSHTQLATRKPLSKAALEWLVRMSPTPSIFEAGTDAAPFEIQKTQLMCLSP
jgi:hypothetical protein